MERLAVADRQPHPLVRISWKNSCILTSAGKNGRQELQTKLPLAITPYYLSLLVGHGADYALRRTVVPVIDEFLKSPGEDDDPLGEEDQSPVPGLVHRYPDRVLFLTLDFCSTYCRYCTRSRVVGHGRLVFQSPPAGKRPGIYPPHTDHPRCAAIGRRSADPGRCAPGLAADPASPDQACGNHPHRHQNPGRVAATDHAPTGPHAAAPSSTVDEPALHTSGRVHPEAYRACQRLADAGIPLGSQTVLLKQINDSVDTMRTLMHHLLQMRVRPYYLYQCDPISGLGAFPHLSGQRPGNHPRPARLYLRLRDPDLRHRRTRRRRQDPLVPRLLPGARRRQYRSEKL
jgi:lysine 2,3-aminomutase